MFVALKTGSKIGLKGSLGAPLFFLALAFALLGSRVGYVTPWAASALALAALGQVDRKSLPCWTWLSLPVAGYALVVAVGTLAMSPAYTPAGLYHPLLLLLAFLSVRSLSPRAEASAAIAAAALIAGLAAWGLFQLGYMSMARARALFEAPSMYATVLNLALVPMMTLILFGIRDSRIAWVAALLSAGLFAADSRGGLLALAAGIGLAVVLGLRARKLQPRNVVFAALLLAIGWSAAAALRALPGTGDLPRQPPPSAEKRAASSLARIELYALSWEAWQTKPLTGTGYLTFRYVQEREREQAPSFGQSRQTWFVHNDYLQTLQELGPVGLAAFLGLTVLPVLGACRKLRGLTESERGVTAAVAAGAAAMAAHALVDFPFYVPACLVLYGAALGAVDRRLSVAISVPSPGAAGAPWKRAMRATFLTVALLILARPVAAEVAAEWGMRKLAQGEGQAAAFWLGAARRIEPADWRYHWYAGRFWEAQALQTGRREAARLAAGAFAAGFDANPLEVENLLGKIAVHGRLPALLDAPADRDTLRTWLHDAESLAPLHPGVAQARTMLGLAQ